MVNFKELDQLTIICFLCAVVSFCYFDTMGLILCLLQGRR